MCHAIIYRKTWWFLECIKWCSLDLVRRGHFWSDCIKTRHDIFNLSWDRDCQGIRECQKDYSEIQSITGPATTWMIRRIGEIYTHAVYFWCLTCKNPLTFLFWPAHWAQYRPSSPVHRCYNTSAKVRSRLQRRAARQSPLRWATQPCHEWHSAKSYLCAHE